MKTVFDFGLTNAEEIELFGVAVDDDFLKKYEELSPDTFNVDLFRLHLLRDQPEAAEGYLQKIKDESIKLAMNLLAHEIANEG